MIAHEILNSLAMVLDRNELLRNAYLWHAPTKARFRRDLEEKYTVPRFEFEYDGKTYSVSLNVSCSCAHVYVYRDYRRDGDKVDVRVLKNIYKKMYDELYGGEYT